MHFLHEAPTTWTTRDDLDGHFLFAPAHTDELGPAGGSRQRPGLCLENPSKQIIQVVQVILAPLPQRFLATIRVVPFFSGGRPGRPGAGWRRPARACRKSSPRGQATALGRPWMGRSYACSVEVRMKGDIDDLQIAYRGKFYRRIACRPLARASRRDPRSQIRRR
jgi:hypothetical protein